MEAHSVLPNTGLQAPDGGLICSPPVFSVRGISQARILEWFAISFSRGSSLHRDRTVSPALAGRFFTTEPLGKHFYLAGLGKGLRRCMSNKILGNTDTVHSSVLAWRIPGMEELGRLPSMGPHRVGND